MALINSLTETSNQSDIGVLEGKLAERKGKLKMLKIDQIVVAAKVNSLLYVHAQLSGFLHS